MRGLCISEQGLIFLTALISSYRYNAEVFRASGGSRAVFDILSSTKARIPALRVIQQLILDDNEKGHDDLSTLLEVLQATPPTERGRCRVFLQH